MEIDIQLRNEPRNLQITRRQFVQWLAATGASAWFPILPPPSAEQQDDEALASLPESDWTVVNERAVPNAVLKDTLGINELGELTVSMENGDTMVWIPERRSWGIVEVQLGRTRVIRLTNTMVWHDNIHSSEGQHRLVDIKSRDSELTTKYPYVRNIVSEVDLRFARGADENSPLISNLPDDHLDAFAITLATMLKHTTGTPTDEQLKSLSEEIEGKNGENVFVTLSNGQRFYVKNGMDIIFDHSRSYMTDVPLRVGENGRAQVVYVAQNYYEGVILSAINMVFDRELEDSGITLPEGYGRRDGYPGLTRVMLHVITEDSGSYFHNPVVMFASNSKNSSTFKPIFAY